MEICAFTNVINDDAINYNNLAAKYGAPKVFFVFIIKKISALYAQDKCECYFNSLINIMQPHIFSSS